MDIRSYHKISLQNLKPLGYITKLKLSWESTLIVDKFDIQSMELGLPGEVELQILEIGEYRILLWHAFPDDWRGIGPIENCGDFTISSFDAPNVFSRELLCPGEITREDYAITACSDKLVSKIKCGMNALMGNGPIPDGRTLNDTEGVRIKNDVLDVVIFRRGVFTGLILVGMDTNVAVELFSDFDKIHYGTYYVRYSDRHCTSLSSNGITLTSSQCPIHWRRNNEESQAKSNFDARVSTLRQFSEDLKRPNDVSNLTVSERIEPGSVWDRWELT